MANGATPIIVFELLLDTYNLKRNKFSHMWHWTIWQLIGLTLSYSFVNFHHHSSYLQIDPRSIYFTKMKLNRNGANWINVNKKHQWKTAATDRPRRGWKWIRTVCTFANGNSRNIVQPQFIDSTEARGFKLERFESCCSSDKTALNPRRPPTQVFLCYREYCVWDMHALQAIKQLHGAFDWWNTLIRRCRRCCCFHCRRGIS